MELNSDTKSDTVILVEIGKGIIGNLRTACRFGFRDLKFLHPVILEKPT